MDTAENWKLKLKTEKHCSKIIFKCVNSTVGPIFNEKIDKKMKFVGPWTMHGCTVHEKLVKCCGYCSWTVAACEGENAWKKKKRNKTQLGNADLESKHTLYIYGKNIIK